MMMSSSVAVFLPLLGCVGAMEIGTSGSFDSQVATRAPTEISLDFSNGYAPQIGPANLVTSGGNTAWIVDDPTGLPRKVLEIYPDSNHDVFLDSSYFQFGTDDFAIEMEMRRNKNEGNAITFQMNGNGVQYYDFYNDYACVSGFGCKWTNCCDWSQWHTHRVVRSGSSIIWYIDGVEIDNFGNNPTYAFNPSQVRFTGHWGGFRGHVANFKVFLHSQAPSAPTPPPTPSPTTAPTPSPTNAASATGDPHLQNIHGERFDLMKPGVYVLINIPREEEAVSAMLRVQADAVRLGKNCGDIYFQTLNVTGSWAEAKQAGGYHYSVSQSFATTPRWTEFGKVALKIVNARSNQDVQYPAACGKVRRHARRRSILGGKSSWGALGISVCVCVYVCVCVCDFV